MRANLTAPALATWLVIGAIICIAWHVPWYLGALGGLGAAALVYWALVALEPRWDLIPDWAWRGFSATAYAAIALAWPTSDATQQPSFELLRWLYAAMAALSLYDCVRSFLRRNRTKAPGR